MSIALIITLILLGILCVVLEILILPGGIVGLIGFLMIAGGVLAAYLTHSALVGTVVLLSTAVATVLLIVLALRSKTWRKMTLQTRIEGKMNTIDAGKLSPGMEGEAVSRIAPMGKGKFGTEIVEVSSEMGWIDVGATLVIRRIEGNKVYVKSK